MNVYNKFRFFIVSAFVSFSQTPEIKIIKNKANIHFIISGRATRIKVENCVQGTERCTMENITVPEVIEKCETFEIRHDFVKEVALADSQEKSFLFSFWIYDGAIVLYPDPTVVQITRSNGQAPFILIIGVVVGVIFAVSAAILVIVLWRKGFLTKKNNELHHHSKRNKLHKDGESRNRERDIPVNIDESSYEMIKPSVPEQSQISAVYKSLLEPEITLFASSSIILDSLLCDGYFYEAWRGTLSQEQKSPLPVIIKKVKAEVNGVYNQYLQMQGLFLTKLRRKNFIIECLGMTEESNLLVMETASLVNLKQYLENSGRETYYN